MKTLCAFDTEYNQSRNADMGLVSAVLQLEGQEPERFPAMTQEDRLVLRNRLEELRETTIFVGYFIEPAECRVVESLGLDSTTFDWIDLFTAWAWLKSVDKSFKYGKGLRVSKADGIQHYYMKETEEDEDDSYEAGSYTLGEVGRGLLDALYKFGILSFNQIKVDYKVKENTRNIIIKGENLEKHLEDILCYNEQDVRHLLPLYHKIESEIQNQLNTKLFLHPVNGQFTPVSLDKNGLNPRHMMRIWGKWSARNAKVAQTGIPLDKDRVDYITNNAAKLVHKLKSDRPALYELNIKKNTYTFKDEKFKTWLEGVLSNYPSAKWPVSQKTGKYKRNNETLEEFTYIPEIEEFRQHLKDIKCMNFFTSVDFFGKIKGLSFIGDDYKQRPMYCPLGTQTGRNAAKATSFLPAQSKWMRCLINPPKGYVIHDYDFKSQEWLICAELSKDPKMTQAYREGDVYNSTGKFLGIANRAVAKTICLGKSYGMGPDKLMLRLIANARALKLPAPPPIAGNEASANYDTTYQVYTNYKKTLQNKWNKKTKECLMIPSTGWAVSTDVRTANSFINFLSQGMGAEILRQCITKLQKAGITVIFPLHDAICCMSKEEDLERDQAVIRKTMIETANELLGSNLMRVDLEDVEVIKHNDFWDYKHNAEKYFEIVEMIKNMN